MKARTGRLWLSLLLSLALILAYAPVSWAVPVPGTDVTYTLDNQFDKGTLLNVNHDAPGSDQLQLNKIAEPFPYVNIAASARGTMIRIDANTGTILGEYWTSPDGMGKDPSRTTVDLLGNTWVTNRAEAGGGKGSITRVGLITGGTRVDAGGNPDPAGEYLKPPFDYSTCVDRNGDGLIHTAKGLGNILSWSNAGGVDSGGGVSTAQDECTINYTRTAGTNARTVAVDANNDVWVGGLGNQVHEQLSGVTGQPVPGTQFNLGCGGYGGFIDQNGILWSARGGTGLLRYDTNTKTGTCMGNSHGDYGLGVDPTTGEVWHTFLSGGHVAKMAPDGTLLGTYLHGEYYAQGVAVDGSGNVWVAHSLYSATTVGHLRTDGTFVGNVTLPGGNGPTGVAVDANGKVWVANINSSNAMRIDPSAGPAGGGGFPVGAVDLTVNLGAGANPYNYSDMTGFVAFGTTSPQGTWTVVQDSGTAGNTWGTITWNTEPQGLVPAGASILVEARAADTEAGLSGEAFVPVTNGVAFALTGRFIEARATLKANAAHESPILSDITVKSANHPPTVSVAPASAVMNEAAPAITLQAVAGDPDGDMLTYTWTLVSGTGVLTPMGSIATYSNDDGPASALVSVTVDDGKGGIASATGIVQVLNVNPAAFAGPDQFQYWGLPITFTGTVSDPSIADTLAGLNPTWTFGDGSPAAAGLTVTHAYADPGLYTVTLTAADKDGGVGTNTAMAKVNKRPTSLAYTGDTTQVFGYPGVLSAQLTDTIDPATAMLGGLTVTFEVNGTTIAAITDSNGVATASAPALLMPGTYTVTAAFAENDHYLASSTTATFTVTNATPGKITGGTLQTPYGGKGGFTVQSDGMTVKGELQYRSSQVDLHGKSITAMGVAPDLKSGWFAGTGTNGETFYVYVEDYGEPGTADVFKLWVDGTLYNGDGSLTGGNIQIHK